MVHSVRLVLAHRAVRARNLSFGLATDVAASYFRHCRSRSLGFDQRAVLSSRETASRTTRYLTPSCLPENYGRVKGRNAC